MPLTLIDILWLIILAVSVVVSILRGFVREVFSLAAWVVALLVASRFGWPLAGVLEGVIGDPQVRAVTAFVSLFLVTLLVGSLISVGAYKFVHKTGLRPTDRTLGLAFGALRGVVIIGIVALVLRGTPVRDYAAYTDAYLRPAVEPVAGFLHRLLPGELGDYFPEAGALPMDEKALEQIIRNSSGQND